MYIKCQCKCGRYIKEKEVNYIEKRKKISIIYEWCDGCGYYSSKKVEIVK